MSTSPFPAHDAVSTEIQQPGAEGGWPQLPVETEIYILPDGRVVVADLPAELATILPRLGLVEPCEITNHDLPDPVA